MYGGRRKGGETGVKAVQCLQGEEMWKALDKAAGRSRCWRRRWNAFRPMPRATIRESTAKTKDAGVFLIEYRDGFRAAVAMLNGWLYEGDGGAFTFAGRLKGQDKPSRRCSTCNSPTRSRTSPIW